MANQGPSWIPATLRERVKHLAATAFMPFARSERRRYSEMRRLTNLAIVIAGSLHQMVEKDDPLVASGVFHLPEALHAHFRQKVFLYRETNILLALLNRVKTSRDEDSSYSLFRRIFFEYERLVFGELPDTPTSAARRHSVKAALEDLNAHMHPPMGNKFDIARDWSRKWFADIGHNEINPETLARFSSFWFSECTAVQKSLEAAVAHRATA
jgi:hypothetical protein